MKHIVVVSHHLIYREYQERWRRLAMETGWSVTVIIPGRWISSYYEGSVETTYGNEEQSGTYSVVCLRASDERRWWRFVLRGLSAALRAIDPDIIFCINDEGSWLLQQVIVAKRAFSLRAEILFFSTHAALHLRQAKRMRRRGYYSLLWRIACAGTDACLVHYPDQVATMRSLGYRNRILVQTQVAVDEKVFKRAEEEGATIRNALGLDRFTAGFCARIRAEKGIFEFVRAIAMCGDTAKGLIVGDGPALAETKALVQRLGCEERIAFAGKVHRNVVRSYLSAMDCFVIASRDTDDWVDTFPNAVVQAMLVGLPVVGTKCGAIPYIIGDGGYIVEQGDAEEIGRRIMELHAGGDGKAFGLQARVRALRMFSVGAVTRSFADFVMLGSGEIAVV